MIQAGLKRLTLPVLMAASIGLYPLAANGQVTPANDRFECLAPPPFEGSSGNRLWPEEDWQSGRSKGPRRPQYVQTQLAGSYRLLVVTSVGAGAKYLAEWKLQLRPTTPSQDSAWRRNWDRPERPVFFPLAGRMSPGRAGYLNGDGQLTPSKWAPAPDSVRIRYEPTSGILRLDGGPFDVLDAGTFYWVYAVDQNGGFRGRWVGGGYAISMFETPLGTLAEQAEGYFCAQRSEGP